MKKILAVLFAVGLLSGCSAGNRDTTSSSSTDSDSSSEISESTSTSSKEQASQNSQSSSTGSTTSSLIEDETSQSSQSASIGTDTNIANEEAAKETIMNYYGFNDDIILTFWQMVDGDYLFKAQSESIIKNGGTGTVGFYRVSSTGEVYEANSDGTIIQ
ncbi:hypothetical protein ACYSNU_02155 [Enterococcus sp. LJL120]